MPLLFTFVIITLFVYSTLFITNFFNVFIYVCVLIFLSVLFFLCIYLPYLFSPMVFISACLKFLYAFLPHYANEEGLCLKGSSSLLLVDQSDRRAPTLPADINDLAPHTVRWLPSVR